MDSSIIIALLYGVVAWIGVTAILWFADDAREQRLRDEDRDERAKRRTVEWRD